MRKPEKLSTYKVSTRKRQMDELERRKYASRDSDNSGWTWLINFLLFYLLEINTTFTGAEKDLQEMLENSEKADKNESVSSVPLESDNDSTKLNNEPSWHIG